MKKAVSEKIAILPGDGIGPEIMEEALKVLRIAGEKANLSFELKRGLIGGEAIDRCGIPLPDETIRLCLESKAVLLGSIGGPKWDHLLPESRPELGGLLSLRKTLKLYANIRPIVMYEELKEMSPLSPSVVTKKIDMVTVREMAKGIYFGKPTKLNENEGMDTMSYQKKDVLKIARIAFETAKRRNKRVTSVDKANVLHSSMLWRRVVNEVAMDYPDIELNHMYVDNAAMQLILNPMQFDVILTTNLFGDIISDESAALSGSLGMLPSASLGESIHLYEPAGGSAPDIAGKCIANPIAMILSVAMMMDFTFKKHRISEAIYHAVESAIKKGFRTRDIATGTIKPVSTKKMGDIICKHLI
jgi:3-isopropylmalate dehydrogenase